MASQPLARKNTLKIVENFPRPAREIEHLWIPLSDGTRLAARIWLPAFADEEPVPAILEYLPYRKRDGTAERDAMTHPYLAGQGYACVRVDMRGSGESDGYLEDEYLAQEQDDALEVIDWIVAQPWCSGQVGMMGISWGGFNALQVAARRPPALKAIVTICSTDDRYADDIHYKGGCLLNDNLNWSAQMMAYMTRPPDPLLVGDGWRSQWLDRLENLPFLADKWLQHQHRDSYWKHGSVCEDFSAIEAAVLAVGGWADAYSNAVPRLLAGLSAPSRGLTGPWVHKYPHIAWPEPAIGFLQEIRRWWDAWLKGEETGVLEDPAYRVFLQESVPPKTEYGERPGRWIGAPQWPWAGIEDGVLALNEGRLEAEAGPEMALTVSSPQSTGLAGGNFCPGMRTGFEMPGDQRHDDAGSLVFDSHVLEEDLAIIGAPQVGLEFSVDRPLALVAVRLCDVHPDGASTRVTYGVFNLTHRENHETPTELEPGKRYQLLISLDDCAYEFPAGHRLRLAISTAYWPLIWPSPEPVTLTLFTGVSCLVLPVAPDEVLPVHAFAAPEASAPLAAESIRGQSASRTTEQDMIDGAWVHRRYDDFGAHRMSEHGLEVGSTVEEIFRIRADDPLSARCDTCWQFTVGRGDWQTRTEVRHAMWSDAANFYLSASLVAFEGDKQVLTKEWEESIPRHLV